MVRVRLLPLWLLLGLAAAASAQPAPPARALLWEVSDGERRLHLLGSVHVLAPGDDPLPGAAAAAYAAAARVVFELHPDSLAAAAAPAALLARALAPAGKPLSLRLGPADADRLDARLAPLGLPPRAFDAFEPWFAHLVLGTTAAQQAGLTAEAGVELQLAARLAADGKAAGALETLAEQVAVFADRPTEHQLASLRAALRDTSAADLGPTVAAWRAGDAAALEALVGEMHTADAAFAARLLDERNARWIPHLEALLRADLPDGRPERVLVVVGAAHLVGPGSVVERLRARGLEVRRVE